MPVTLPPGTTPCKHFEICQLAATQGEFCILHFPQQEGKNIATFQQALDAHLASGRCDFRYVYFPAGEPPPYFDRRQFASVADFQGAMWSGTLRITEARFEEGLLFGGEQVGNVALQESVVRGPLRLQAQAINNTVRLHQTVLEGSVDISVKSLIHFQAWKAQFCGHVSIHAAELGSLDLPYTELLGGLTLRALCQPQRNLYHVKIHGTLDLGECEFIGGLSFADIVFDADSVLDLTGAIVRGDFVAAETRGMPRKIFLDGIRIAGNSRLQAELGARRPLIVAEDKPPRFGGRAIFTNVALNNCRLSGNVVEEMEFTNVEWPTLGPRSALYDEVPLRRLPKAPLSNPQETYQHLREIYQVLKEKYRKVGDHVRGGDFHYGEMEMKRREYGLPRRVASPEFLYWLTSGYGTRWRRASGWLLFLIIFCAGLYYVADTNAFEWNFLNALRFSLSVATLQRPDFPADDFSEAAQWAYRLEAILGPLLIALLGWALRMRVKR